jgi:rare lipoprotein A (peptidoglycan hydrolase)
VYHEVIASWYGPGGVTACGDALGSTTMGVANKTLPCGTMVTLRYRERTIRVPVIDRGPYVTGRDYDLTYATRLALGAGDVSQIWASA